MQLIKKRTGHHKQNDERKMLHLQSKKYFRLQKKKSMCNSGKRYKKPYKDKETVRIQIEIEERKVLVSAKTRLQLKEIPDLEPLPQDHEKMEDKKRTKIPHETRRKT